MNKPQVSVIIPCYNAAAFLPQCMASLAGQTMGLENLELIFVDDASTDDGATWNQILDFEQKYPDSVIAIQSEENLCQGGARNIGMKHASADYIGFVDADDWVDLFMYEKLYEKIEKYQCDIVDCRIVVEEYDGMQRKPKPINDIFIEKEKNVIEGGTHWISDLLDDRYGGGIVTRLYHRDLLMENNIFFPEHLKYEDNYWDSILMLYVKSIYHMSECLYHYRVNLSSTIHSRNAKYHLDRMPIELMKVERFKELQVFERFFGQIEAKFIEMYYCITVTILWSRFDDPPYKVYLEMVNTIRRLFPNYKENPYIPRDDINWQLIQLMDWNLNEEQFKAAGDVILQFIEEHS